MVDPQVASDRLQRLQALLSDQQRTIQDEMVGKTLSVLLEKPGREPGQMVGKSEYLHAVHVYTDAPTGTLLPVRVTASLPNSLAAEPL